MPTPTETLQTDLLEIFEQGTTYTDGELAKVYVSTAMAEAIDTYTQAQTVTAPPKNVGGYWMINNTTATAIPSGANFYKLAGVTTAWGYVLGFTHTDNRSTCTDATAKYYEVQVKSSIQAPNQGNNFTVRIAKNGTTLQESESRSRTQANAYPEHIACQTIVELVSGDYIEVWVRNTTSTPQALTAVTLNTIIKEL